MVMTSEYRDERARMCGGSCPRASPFKSSLIYSESGSDCEDQKRVQETELLAAMMIEAHPFRQP
jgi:hypothetical protein